RQYRFAYRKAELVHRAEVNYQARSAQFSGNEGGRTAGHRGLPHRGLADDECIATLISGRLGSDGAGHHQRLVLDHNGSPFLGSKTDVTNLGGRAASRHSTVPLAGTWIRQ